MKILEEGFDDVMAVMSLPKKYRQRFRTSNGVERLNEEIRRRDRVIRIYPNSDSVIRLIGALLMEQDERWQRGRNTSTAGLQRAPGKRTGEGKKRNSQQESSVAGSQPRR